ncbi:hypothetical protein JK386_14355 [Nocardioides sp. zg-536]|uniref:Uncharacterized protein n=1 Tax=Nocardioides faecalis TaxID=2803858 RepID=A0A939BZI8_9ACTN|nr:hypothetical protein [Nocardioides faecalis]MBM9461080.1 hypothetical protein [Nocardioides faecalis]QVI59162.1 hypothetical protein KG111_01895 [Nocardioides faecalis]
MASDLLPARSRARLLRRVLAGVAVLGVLAVLGLSHSFGRAVPTGNYRPPLPPAALSTGCFPLPGDARLDLPHQVRWDGDVETATGVRRELRGQYDLLDRDEALAEIVAAFAAVGFTERSRTDDGETVSVELGDGTQRVGLRLAALPDTDAETLVRGSFVLDLPVVAAASDDPVCADPKSTKRWGDRRLPR